MSGAVAAKSSKDKGAEPTKGRSPVVRGLAQAEPQGNILTLQHSIGNRALGDILQQKQPSYLAPSITNLPPSVQSVLRGGGRPLHPQIRAEMESRFDHDFSGVQVHTDAKAADSAQALLSRAYTVGNQVVFGSGRYAPETWEGKRLLAHELAHVMQQTPGARRGGSASDPEGEAAAAGRSAASGCEVSVGSTVAIGIQCEPLSAEELNQVKAIQDELAFGIYNNDQKAKLRKRLAELAAKQANATQERAHKAPEEKETAPPDKPDSKGSTPKAVRDYAMANPASTSPGQKQARQRKSVNIPELARAFLADNGIQKLLADARTLTPKQFAEKHNNRSFRDVLVGIEAEIYKVFNLSPREYHDFLAIMESHLPAALREKEGPSVDIDRDFIAQRQAQAFVRGLQAIREGGPLASAMVLARSTVTNDPEELAKAAEQGSALWGFVTVAAGVRQGRADFAAVGGSRPISDPPAIIEQSKTGSRPAARPLPGAGQPSPTQPSGTPASKDTAATPAVPVLAAKPAPPLPASQDIAAAPAAPVPVAKPAPPPAVSNAAAPAVPAAPKAPVLAPGMSTGEAAEAAALKPSRSNAALLGEKAGGYDAVQGGKKIINSEVNTVDKKGNPIIVRDVTIRGPDDAIQIKTITQLDKYGQPSVKPLPQLVADNVRTAIAKAYNQPATRARARSPLPGTTIYERANIEAPKKITIIVQVPGKVTPEMQNAAAKVVATDPRVAELPPIEVIVQSIQ